MEQRKKMKIACNSAYVKTETLNFTFAWQAVIVYFNICSNHRHIKCVWLLSLWQRLLLQSAAMKPKYWKCVITCLHISLKPQHRPRIWLCLQKANEPRVPTIYCQLFMHKLSTFLLNKYAIETMGLKPPKSPPLRAYGPRLIHPSLHWPHSPPQTTAWSIHERSHNYTTKSPMVTVGCPKFTPKTVPSPLTITTIKYTHPLTNPTHHPKRHPDAISRFATVHFLDSQTHRPTDGIGNRSISVMLTLYW